MSQSVQVVERPILFSGAMVRAILEGRKTQTRRVVTPQNAEWGSAPAGYWDHADFSRAWVDGKKSDSWYLHVPCHKEDGDKSCDWCNIYGKAGTVHRLWPRISPAHEWLQTPEHDYTPPASRLWVRETWQHVTKGMEPTKGCRLLFRADDIAGHIDSGWRPSIHMPRWASRLTLEIVKVRVERLQDISEQDAIAEGVGWEVNEAGGVVPKGYYRSRFTVLWDSINSKRGHGWDKNDWVWAITFQRVRS